jgi:hypothetical protein
METPIAAKALAVRVTSPLAKIPEILVLPTVSAAKISARWEMDLSPGTEVSPRKPADGAARYCVTLLALAANGWLILPGFGCPPLNVF